MAAAALRESSKHSLCLLGRSGRTVYSENPVASSLGQVPPGFPEARTSCSVVIMCWFCYRPFSGNLMADSCLLVIYWVQAWPQKWPHDGHRPEAEAVLGGSCYVSLPLRAECLEAHRDVGKWAARSCLPVERWVAPHQRVGALLNSYLRLLNPTQVPLVTLLMCSQVHSRCHIGG